MCVFSKETPTTTKKDDHDECDLTWCVTGRRIRITCWIADHMMMQNKYNLAYIWKLRSAVVAFESTDADGDALLLLVDDRLLDGIATELDGAGGARFSFCNSFKCDVPLIIVELNWGGGVGWGNSGGVIDCEDWWSDSSVVVVDADDSTDSSSSSADSHKLTFASVEQSRWRSVFLMKKKNFNCHIDRPLLLFLRVQ